MTDSEKLTLRIDHPKHVFNALRDLMDDDWNAFIEWYGKREVGETIPYDYCANSQAVEPSQRYRAATLDDWSDSFFKLSPIRRIEWMLEYHDEVEK